MGVDVELGLIDQAQVHRQPGPAVVISRGRLSRLDQRGGIGSGGLGLRVAEYVRRWTVLFERSIQLMTKGIVDVDQLVVAVEIDKQALLGLAISHPIAVVVQVVVAEVGENRCLECQARQATLDERMAGGFQDDVLKPLVLELGQLPVDLKNRRRR